MQELLQQVVNGLSYGAIYALIAVGYTMVYGVLRLINFAHGDIYMIGAMTGLYVFTRLSVAGVPSWSQAPHWLAAGTAVVAAGLVALLIGRVVHRPWRRRPRRLLTAGIGAALLVLGVCPFLRWAPVQRPPSWVGFAAVLVTAMVVCGFMGFCIEQFAYRPIRSQPRITALITAIGVSMFLEYGGQGVFGATPQAFPRLIPGLEENPALFAVGGVLVGRVDAIILVATLAVMLLLWWVVMRTRTGMALRAVSHRFDTAALMGINVDRIISFTFIVGSALAGLAGVLVALRSPKVDPLMGLIPGLKAFVAAVLGGIGSIPGAVLGGLMLGLTEVMVAGYLPAGSQYREGVAFVILIAVLLVKPAGLLGLHEVEKV